MPILTEAEEISDIAFGYMASKALFAALHFGIFTHLSQAPARVEDLAAKIGVPAERCRTLLTALAALGLIERDGGAYRNSPAAERFLVKGAKYDFSDYLRLQVHQQMYPLMDQIEPALAGELPEEATASYAEWFSDPEEARLYSESQHAGSLGPALGLARRVDLSGARKLLDVGGGTGAFAITLCEAFPELSATIVDFPNVATLGRTFIDKAGLSDRIAYREGNALETDWPEAQDAILMSYLLSGVPDHTHVGLIERALRHLAPGGLLMVHDFIVDSDRAGPKNTALWQLQHTAFTPEARSLADDWLETQLKAAGFENVSVEPLIPGMTKLAVGTRPA
ncbi:acetylserotonin O-methyltransferase [Stappia indica]|uniref:acetylserotonin O-methyltransferase n=1 Tax=Stappia indica TaxID=538381 RepID=UPI001CD205B6|nr:acetylserotonin O-methyltransferase [Stappia indica]MCA1300142.1 acetylserotonin O-methyltransferase [Stappia indica]